MPWPAVPRRVDLWDVAIQKLGFLANPSFTLRSPSAARQPCASLPATIASLPVHACAEAAFSNRRDLHKRDGISPPRDRRLGGDFQDHGRGIRIGLDVQLGKSEQAGGDEYQQA